MDCARTIVNLKTIRQLNSIAGIKIDTEAASLWTPPEWESKTLMDDDSFEKLDNLEGVLYNMTQFSDVFVSAKNSTAIEASPSPWASYFGSLQSPTLNTGHLGISNTFLSFHHSLGILLLQMDRFSGGWANKLVGITTMFDAV